MNTKLSLVFFVTLVCFQSVNSFTLDLYDEIACSVDTGPRIIEAETPGLFTTPDWNATDEEAVYPPNSLCEWQITQNGPDALELKFINFTLELSEQCKNDYVEVYDGEDGDDPDRLIGRYCGQQAPSPILRESGDTIFVRFVSDESLEYPGFLARYGVPTLDVACDPGRPQVITAPEGSFSSPNWPISYPENSNCQWKFEAQEGFYWVINTTFFQTENCCSCDIYEVYDGDSTTAVPRWGAWFGSNTHPPQMRTTGQDLYVRFSSDSSVSNYPGFLAVYAQVPFGQEPPEFMN